MINSHTQSGKSAALVAIRLAVSCLLLALAGAFGSFHAQAQTDEDESVIGKVVSWGSNSLGLTNTPPDLTNVVAIAAGSVHSVALKSDGTVRAWGRGRHGETNVPPGLSNVVAIAAAGFFSNAYGYSLALKDDGTLTAWGALSLPSGLSNLVAIAAGAYWWIALKGDGTVTANYPFLTNGLLSLGDSPASNVVAVASGGRHLLALTRSGTVIGWGINNFGQAIGVPSADLYYTNAVVTLAGRVLSNVVAIAAGDLHSVALKNDGTVVVWGNGARGQTNVPSGLSNVVAIASSGNESANQVLAIKADGTLVAWGGNTSQTNVPPGLTNVAVASVGSAHSLTLIGTKPFLREVRLSAPVWKASTFSFSLPTRSGRVYSLEYLDPFSDSQWTSLLLVPGNGHLRTLTDFNAATLGRYYRVRQW